MPVIFWAAAVSNKRKEIRINIGIEFRVIVLKLQKNAYQETISFKSASNRWGAIISKHNVTLAE
jgi:hypothetical protein